MYTDIHNHCLPGVDDGARSLEEALAMLRISERAGVRQVIATPHYHYRRGHADAEEIRKKTAELSEAARREGISVELFCGNEIYYSHDVAGLLKEKRILTLAESEYALIEFSPTAGFESVRDGLYEILSSGYHPILAHADRVHTLVENPYQAGELVEMGAYIQVNAESVKSNTTRPVKKFVRILLENQMVHFVASDAHDVRVRTPDMSKDLAYIGKKYGEHVLHALLCENPGKIIRNELI